MHQDELLSTGKFILLVVPREPLARAAGGLSIPGCDTVLERWGQAAELLL